MKTKLVDLCRAAVGTFLLSVCCSILRDAMGTAHMRSHIAVALTLRGHSAFKCCCHYGEDSQRNDMRKRLILLCGRESYCVPRVVRYCNASLAGCSKAELLAWHIPCIALFSCSKSPAQHALLQLQEFEVSIMRALHNHIAAHLCFIAQICMEQNTKPA